MSDEELTELDLAVARVLGKLNACVRLDTGKCSYRGCGHPNRGDTATWYVFQPTRNWADAGPLIHKFYMEVQCVHKASQASDGQEPWIAHTWSGAITDGPTPLIAICRAMGGE
jgi:hypothetical protein